MRECTLSAQCGASPGAIITLSLLSQPGPPQPLGLHTVRTAYSFPLPAAEWPLCLEHFLSPAKPPAWPVRRRLHPFLSLADCQRRVTGRARPSIRGCGQHSVSPGACGFQWPGWRVVLNGEFLFIPASLGLGGPLSPSILVWIRRQPQEVTSLA